MSIIMKQGFDERVGSLGGMYGAGIYFAEKSSKADAYAGRPNGRENSSVGEIAKMVLARVTLGTSHHTQHSLYGLRRPPCEEGHFGPGVEAEVNSKRKKRRRLLPIELDGTLCDHRRCDSVIAGFRIDGRTKNYREFVVYDRNLCYPEFVVEYERIE